MADQDSGYFGLKLGEALERGAGHIASALQRKYEFKQRQQEREAERARQNQMIDRQMGLTLAAKGVAYDPTNPAASFEAFRAQSAGDILRSQEAANLNRQKTQAEINLLNKRAGQPEVEKAPPGYRWTAQNTLEAIPGGPADIKATDIEEKKRMGIETQKIRNQNVIDTVDSALKDVGMFTSGFAGNILKNVGGTSAADLEGKINTIQANLGFDRLTQMRAESPTGGALGQVSEKELTLLTSAVASLSQKQSPAQLRENLERIKTHLENWQATVDQAKSEGMAQTAQAAESGWDASKEQRYQELLRKRGGK